MGAQQMPAARGGARERLAIYARDESGDNGVHTFTGLVLNKKVAQTITVKRHLAQFDRRERRRERDVGGDKRGIEGSLPRDGEFGGIRVYWS